MKNMKHGERVRENKWNPRVFTEAAALVVIVRSTVTGARVGSTADVYGSDEARDQLSHHLSAKDIGLTKKKER